MSYYTKITTTTTTHSKITTTATTHSISESCESKAEQAQGVAQFSRMLACCA